MKTNKNENKEGKILGRERYNFQKRETKKSKANKNENKVKIKEKLIPKEKKE